MLVVLKFSVIDKVFIGLPKDSQIWFTSGLLLIVLGTFVTEKYFTKPLDVIVNIVTLFVVLLTLDNVQEFLLYMPLLVYASLTAVIALLSFLLADEEKDANSLPQKIANSSYVISSFLGSSKMLFSIVFILSIFSYFMTSLQNNLLINNKQVDVIYMIIFWGLIILIDPIDKKLITPLINKIKDKPGPETIGKIFGVQSKKIFLAKLFEEKNIKKFDIVKFKYPTEGLKNVLTGIVFDTYLLNQEKWIKVLQLNNPSDEKSNLNNNIIYKINDADGQLSELLGINNIVGLIIEGSTIGKIKFEYSKKKDDLQEGDLLELNIEKKRIFYQVINGITDKEKSEAHNENGIVKGEAIQLGEWNSDKLSFQKFGWVPTIATPLFKASTSDLTVNNFEYPNYKLGIIPGTSLPSIINLNEAVSHHLALLGITGCGKSYLAQKIIEELLVDTKIICIDFTGEWKKNIDAIKYNLINKDDIDSYLSGDDKKIAIFELPALSNTTEVLVETQEFIEKIFNFAKSQYDSGSPAKIALVLEEAHTITPETNFLGDFGDYSANKALVNKMSQIALQGRKYGVGLIVIAQRTANVSKTVLTQCNTVVCFQAFDETSFTFLGNYVGKEMIQILPNLKEYHAIVVGKAIKSNIPMIIDLKR